MKSLLLLSAVFLSACSTTSIVSSPTLPNELKVSCGDVIAQPLTTGDQYDLARALVEAIQYGKDCRSRMNELLEAIAVREQVTGSLK